MASIRQQVIAYVVQMLKRIRTVQGFNTDLGESVYVWRAVPVTPQELPIIVLRDVGCSFADHAGYKYEHKVSFEVEATFVPSHDDTSADLCAAHEDMYKALFWTGDMSLGAIALDLQLTGSDTSLEQEGDGPIGTVLFRFDVTFRTLRSDEATQ